MYLYIETWNVTQKWMKLPKEERRQFLNKMEERIAELSKSGVENLGWAMNDEHTPYRSDYRYIAVWKMPSKQEAELLEENVKNIGWHEYFSQANSRGKMISGSQAIDFLLNLEENSSSMV